MCRAVPASLRSWELRSHYFVRMLCIRNKSLSTLWQTAVTLTLIASAALICIGTFIPSFQINLSGYLGGLVGQSADPYSLASLIQKLPDASLSTATSIIYFFQIVMVLICVVIPLVWLLQVTILWTIPMRPRWQRRMRTLAEVLHAWSCLDVFLLTVLVSLMELDKFTQFMVGGECDSLNLLVAKYVSPSEASGGCINVETSVMSGFAVLFLASFFCMCVGHFIMYAANTALGGR